MNLEYKYYLLGFWLWVESFVETHSTFDSSTDSLFSAGLVDPP